MNTVEAWREDTGDDSDTIKADLQERMMARYMTPIEDVVSGPKLLADAQEPQRASTRPYLEDGLTTVWTECVQDVLANEPVRRDNALVSKAYEIGKKSVNDTIDQWFYDPVTAEAVAMDSVLMNALSPWRKFGKIQRAGKTVLGKAAKRVGEDVAHKAGSPRAGGSAPSTSKPSAPDGARSAAPGKQPATTSSTSSGAEGFVKPHAANDNAPLKILRDRNGRIKGVEDCQEHHIVSNKHNLTKNHKLWELSGLDPEARLNKMFLPTVKGAKRSTTQRSIHQGRHRGEISRELAEKMDDIVERGQRQNWTREHYREEFLKIIKKERGKLQRGETALNKHARPQANE